MIKNLQNTNAKSFSKEPQNMAKHWKFTVLDPMGNTVDIYSELTDTPESEKWIG